MDIYLNKMKGSLSQYCDIFLGGVESGERTAAVYWLLAPRGIGKAIN